MALVFLGPEDPIFIFEVFSVLERYFYGRRQSLISVPLPHGVEWLGFVLPPEIPPVLPLLLYPLRGSPGFAQGGCLFPFGKFQFVP